MFARLTDGSEGCFPRPTLEGKARALSHPTWAGGCLGLPRHPRSLPPLPLLSSCAVCHLLKATGLHIYVALKVPAAHKVVTLLSAAQALKGPYHAPKLQCLSKHTYTHTWRPWGNTCEAPGPKGVMG